MDNKKEIKLSLASLIIMLIIFVMLGLCAYLTIKNNAELSEAIRTRDRQILELENQLHEVNSSKEVTNDIAVENTVKEEISQENKTTSNKFDSNISFVVAGIEKIPSNDGITYEYKAIDSEKELKEISKMINNAELYVPNSDIFTFGDCPNIMSIYLSNGRTISLMAVDDFIDEGDIVNLICIYYTDTNANLKTLYKLDSKFSMYIDNLFKNNMQSTITRNKDIYTKVATCNVPFDEEDYYDIPFLVIENENIYFSNNLVDKIYEGTFKINNKTIDYTLKTETQDYAYYTASTFKLETNNSIEYIRIEQDEDTYILYEKVN